MTFIILGQSVTAIKFIEKLRAHDRESEIVVAAFDENLPAQVERFPELIARQISRADVLYQNENFYRNLRVEFISDKKVNRVNFNRKTVFFDDKSRLEGDVIIIADADKDCFSDIKGTNKEGVFSLRGYGQAASLLNMINHIDTIVLESETLRGILLAQSLVAQEKEVIFCIPSGRLWPEVLDEVSSDFVISLLGHLGVRIIRNGSIREVLGETDVKAVRLSVGKVIAAEIVVFPDALPDMRLYNKGDLVVEDRIQTDKFLRTNCEGIFAIDDMSQGFISAVRDCDAEAFYNDQVSRLLAAVQQTDDELSSELPQFHFEVAGHVISVLGNTAGQDSDIFIKSDENGFLQKRLFVKNNVVQGAILVDNTTIEKDIQGLIQTQQVVDPVSHECFADCAKEGGEEGFTQPVEKQEVVSDLDSEKAESQSAAEFPPTNEVETESQY